MDEYIGTLVHLRQRPDEKQTAYGCIGKSARRYRIAVTRDVAAWIMSRKIGTIPEIVLTSLTSDTATERLLWAAG